MRELALFAGAGGGILGGKLLGWETVCAVEIEPYCREVLLARQRDGVLPLFPIWDDIRTFDGKPWRGIVDVVSGGFPCQPFSVAGKRLADADERNLWPETARVLGDVRPRWALLENVPGLVSHDYFGTIIGDLAALGYDAAWGVVGADDVGAPHRRRRLWIVAYADERGREVERITEHGGLESASRNLADGRDSWRLGGGAHVADSIGQRGRSGPTWREDAANAWQSSRNPWEHDPADDPQSGMGRVAHGVAHRAHRLRALGNGQVPLSAATAFQVLSRVLREA